MTDKVRESIKESYKDVTDQIYILRESFKESGFSDEESFILVESYIRQTIFDNIIRSASTPTYRDRTEYYKRMRKMREEKTE